MKEIISLVNVFALLSIVAIGGGNSVLPEMEHEAVAVHHWVTPEGFAAIFSLGQIAPGPNLSMVGLIGFKVAGLPGMIAVLLAFYIPSSILVYFVCHIWETYKGNPWRDAVQKGLAPITIGFMLAGVYAIGKTASFNVSRPLSENLITLGIGAVVAITLCLIRINPSLLILGGGIAGILLLR